LTWIVRKECWLPKPFGDPKKSVRIWRIDLDFSLVGHTLD
jgi:hypothetical protein